MRVASQMKSTDLTQHHQMDFGGMRPIGMPEADFGKALGRVLSPSRPLQSEEFLKGREQQLTGIKRALYQEGRHILIHGLRGVGKSSLAQTSAYSLPNTAEPIVIGCDEKSTFRSLMKEVFDQAEEKAPHLGKEVRQGRISFAQFGIGAQAQAQREYGPAETPASVNEAVRLIEYIESKVGKKLVVVIDEFDLISGREEQVSFTNFIKQISDRHVSATFIVCGIGESAQALMSAHASADRYFHTVNLGPLPWEARFEIVETAASALGILVDRDTVIRIARISNGFPHYVHFVSEHLFWSVFGSRGYKVTPEIYQEAISKAAAAMDMKLRGPYEKATQKYNNDYETILWAAADGHELRRRSTDIFVSYERIMRDRDEDALPRSRFNQRINALKKESHAAILTGTRAGWYEFSEMMIRGYVRLRAEIKGVELDDDHPAVSGANRTLD